MKTDYKSECQRKKDIEKSLDDAGKRADAFIGFKLFAYPLVAFPAIVAAIFWSLDHLEIRRFDREGILDFCIYTTIGAFICFTPVVIRDLCKLVKMK